MHRIQYYIYRKFLLFFLGTASFVSPLLLFAQEDDTTVIYTDSTVARDWEEDSQNKVGKYSAEAVFRSVPDTTVARMQKEKDFLYANDPEYWVKTKKVYKKDFWDYLFGFFASDAVRIIFYILVSALVLFVLYRIIVVNDLFVFYSSQKKKLGRQELKVSELDPGNIDNNINDAIDQKRFNVAVRFLYLKTLYMLNDKKHIQFHPEATNNDYLTQMSQHKMVRDFRFLTRVYEYVCYGQFDINEQQFSVVHSNFKNFHAGI